MAVFGFWERRKHDRLRDLLSPYLDGEVSASQARDVELHLSVCSDCEAELESLRATVGLVNELPQLEASRSFALTEAPVPVRQPARMVWTTRLAASATAVFLVALVAGDAMGFVTQGEVPSLSRTMGQEAAAPDADQFGEGPSVAMAPAEQEAQGMPPPPGDAADSFEGPQGSARPEGPAGPPGPAGPEQPSATTEPQSEMGIMAAPPEPTPGPTVGPRGNAEPAPAPDAATTPTPAPASGPEGGEERGQTFATTEDGDAPAADQPAPESDGSMESAQDRSREPSVQGQENQDNTLTMSDDAAQRTAGTPEQRGALAIPLRQLQFATGGLLVVLAGAALWAARRTNRWPYGRY